MKLVKSKKVINKCNMDTEVCECCTAGEVVDLAIDLLMESRTHEGRHFCQVGSVLALMLALRIAFRITAVAEAEEHRGDREIGIEITKDFFIDMEHLCEGMKNDLADEIMRRAVQRLFPEDIPVGTTIQ